MKKYFILFWMYTLLLTSASFAQTGGDATGMAVGMRSNGKIYVVVAVVVTILLGLFIYLANIDKRITKMEKELRSGK